MRFMRPRERTAQPSLAGTPEPKPQLRPVLTGYTAMPWRPAIRTHSWTSCRLPGLRTTGTCWVVAKVAVAARARIAGSVCTCSAPRRLRHCATAAARSEEHTSELQSPDHLVCRLPLEQHKRAT